ncbi:MAG: hypothetical protein ACTS2F_21605 [Thainema sp.]
MSHLTRLFSRSIITTRTRATAHTIAQPRKMQTLQRLLIGSLSASIILQLTTAPGQAQTLQQEQLSEPNSVAQLIAQVPHYCGPNESVFITAQTQNFIVSICGGDFPSHYVGVDQSNGNSIRLPLSDYDPQGRYFEAANGDYLYILADTPRGKFLTVTQGTQELLREPVLRGF